MSARRFPCDTSSASRAARGSAVLLGLLAACAAPPPGTGVAGSPPAMSGRPPSSAPRPAAEDRAKGGGRLDQGEPSSDGRRPSSAIRNPAPEPRDSQAAIFPPPPPAAKPPESQAEVLTPGGGTSGRPHPALAPKGAPREPSAPAAPEKPDAKPDAAQLRDDLLRELERQSAERANDARLTQQIVLLHILREDWPAAAQAVERLDVRDDTWRLLAAALESRVGKNAEAGGLLEEVRRRWRAAAPLQVRRALLCQKVVEFGRVVPFPPGRTFAARDAFFLYLEIDHAVPEQLPSGETRLALHWDLELFDPAGRRVPTPTWDAYPRDDVRTLAGYVNDVCVPYLMYLPEGLAGGMHTLRVTVSDAIGHKQGDATVEIPVKGP